MKKWLLETRLTYKQWVSLAVFVSCLLGLMVYMSLSGTESSAQDGSKVEMVKVVVAKQDIPERTIIKDNMLKVVDMPADRKWQCQILCQGKWRRCIAGTWHTNRQRDKSNTGVY